MDIKMTAICVSLSQIHLFFNILFWTSISIKYEGVARSRKSKDRQYKDQMKKDKQLITKRNTDS